MKNYDVAEWKWLFHNAIDWDKIIPLYYPQFPTEDGFENREELMEFFTEVLSQIANWSAKSIGPRARRLDEEGAGIVQDGCTIPSKALQEFYDEAKELQFFGLSAPTKYDGLGAPMAVSLLASAHIGRGCSASFIQMGCFIFGVDMLERFCEQDIRDKYIPLVLEGKISGSMCLTEPNSGSDVGSMRTKAVKQPDGTYRLTGNKIFISNGGGGFAFVLAREEGDPDGLEGLSLFFVEEWLEVDGNKVHNYRIVKNEEKMGLHGSFTCEVIFDNAVAINVGNKSEGFKKMLHLMNEARIATGIQSLGGMEACLGSAIKYAEERIQFGKPIAKLPLMERNLKDYKTEMDAFRALIVDTISWYDVYQRMEMLERYGQELTSEQQKLFSQAKKWVRRRTPLVKYYGSQAFAELSLKAIQIHGGYGFMKEYDVERIHRDSIGSLLYEGTSQIQSLMAMKDLLKFMTKNPKRWLETLVKGHPLGGFIEGSDQITRIFRETQYSFKKNFTGLVMKCLKPKMTMKEFMLNLSAFLQPKNWQQQENIDRLVTHAETLCQAMSYLETLRVLEHHAHIDASRHQLFLDYYSIIAPRLAAIYTDWKMYKVVRIAEPVPQTELVAAVQHS